MTVRCQQDLLFSSQTCRVFESYLPCFDSGLPCLESVLLIFRLRPSNFFGSVLPSFPIQFHSFFESDLLPIFFTLSFRLLPILCSNVIAMSTADKIKDVGVCRKRLHCTTNSLARETNQQNTTRQDRKREK